MNLQDYIAIYNAIDPIICEEITNTFEKLQWEKHSYFNPVSKKSTTYEDDLDISFDTNHNDILENYINMCIKDYIFNIVPIPFDIQAFSHIRFNKYQPETKMKFHHDHIHTIFDGEKKGVPILTILGLLNNDFEGGDFLMFDNKKIELNVGDILKIGRAHV